MSLFVLIAFSLFAVLLSLTLTPVTIAFARRIGAIDQPSERKVHRAPVPRLGGVAVVSAAAIAVALQLFFAPPTKFLGVAEFWLALAVGIVPIFLVSLRDDIQPLTALPKLLAQMAGASTAVLLGIRLAPEINLFGSTLVIGWLAIPLSILWLVGVTNAFNLVDGLDGLSGGLAFIAAISLGAISVVARRPEMATASFIVAGALAGFLPYNIHPARVFLGDAGATSIGFTLGALALSGGSTLSAGMAILVPVLVVGLPLAETVVSMARRGIHRLENSSGGGVMEADRNHFHHRLLGLGLTHGQAVCVLYGAGLMFAACAIASLFMTYRHAAVLLLVFVVAAFVGLHKLGYDEFALIRRGTVLKAYEVPVLRSTLFVVFVDMMLTVAALYLALVLKYDDFAIRASRDVALQMLPIVVATTTLALLTFRVYRASWRSASVEDLMRPTVAIITAGIASWVLVTLATPAAPPISLQVIFTAALLGLVNGSRASYRMLKQWNRRASADGEPVLIYGAGVAGTMALREALWKQELQIKPIGFIDDDPHLQGRFVNGLPVVGSFETLNKVLANSEASGVIIATDKLPRQRVDEIAAICDAAGRWTQYFSIQILSKYDSGVVARARLPIRKQTLTSVVNPPSNVSSSIVRVSE